MRLRRELNEELGIDATIGEEVARIRHEYKNGSAVELGFYVVREYKGEIENRIFKDMRWAVRWRAAIVRFSGSRSATGKRAGRRKNRLKLRERLRDCHPEQAIAPRSVAIVRLHPERSNSAVRSNRRRTSTLHIPAYIAAIQKDRAAPTPDEPLGSFDFAEASRSEALLRSDHPNPIRPAASRTRPGSTPP